MNFDALRGRLAGLSVDELTAAVDASTGKKDFGPDERFWKLTRDKLGNGQAVIRFLPSVEGEAPWISYMDHGFKGPTGKWYIEKSRKTLSWDHDDPVSEWLEIQYNKGDHGKDIVNKVGAKRRTHFVSNILIVQDFGNPENNGKVMLFEYGKSIMDMVKDAMHPTFEGQATVTAFDPTDKGANFNLRVRKVDNFPKYDKSEFSQPAPLANSIDDIVAVLDQAHSLNSLISPDKFKSYEELSRHFNKVMNLSASIPAAAQPAVGNERASSFEATTPNFSDDSDDSLPFEPDATAAPAPDDALAYFRAAAADKS